MSAITRAQTTVNYIMGGEVLAAVSSQPYLGMEIHEKLSWKPHIKAVAARWKPTGLLPSSEETSAYVLPPSKKKACTTGIRGSHMGSIPAESDWQPGESAEEDTLHYRELQQRRQYHGYEIVHRASNSARTTITITSSHITRLFEMIIYWFFLKNVTFYFTKKLETRCK